MEQIKLPLCFDHHNHFTYYISLFGCPSLADVQTQKEAWQFLESLPKQNITLVTGWHSDRFQLSREKLDKLQPLIIVNWCLHGYLINKNALDITGWDLDSAKKTPAQMEQCMPKMMAFFADMRSKTPGFWMNTAACYIEKMRSLGLYGLDDMLKLHNLNICEDTFKVNYYADPDNENLSKDSQGCKLFLDGAVGSSNAALKDGFTNGGVPILNYTEDELYKKLLFCFEHFKSVALHAIGDMAVSQALKVYDRICKESSFAYFTSSKLRLEHCQFITLPQAENAKKLGVILSMQPNFNDDSLVYRDRLSEKQCEGNNPFRMLIDKAGFVPGKDLLFGSDGMPSGLASALENSLFPTVPGQALTPDELMQGYAANESKGYVNLLIDYDKKKVTYA